LTPIYKITLDGADITANFNDRLLSVTAKLQAGNEGNTIDIELDDRDSAIAMPPKGRTLELFLGYKETGVTSVGTYTIQTVTLAWEPAKKMSIHGKSADLDKQSLKEHRNENYEDMSLEDIVGKIATRNGLTPLVAGAIGASKSPMIHQTDESDMNFLTRLSREQDGLFTVAGGKLVMSQRGHTISAGGVSMDVSLTPGDVKSVKVSHPDRSKFEGAQAYSYNTAKGLREAAASAKGRKGFILKHNLINPATAQAAATSRKNELDRALAEAHAETALGDATITASGSLTLANFRDGIDGTYTIKSVEHNFDSSGFTTKIDAEDKNDSDDEDPPEPATP
jgi:phage protein D